MLTKTDVELGLSAEKTLSLYTNTVHTEIERVIKCVTNYFGEKYSCWHFYNAGEGEVGTFSFSDLGEDDYLNVVIDGLGKKSSEYLDQFTSDYLYLTNDEIYACIRACIRKTEEENKIQEEKKNSAKNKKLEEKKKAKEKVLSKLSPEEKRLLGIK